MRQDKEITKITYRRDRQLLNDLMKRVYNDPNIPAQFRRYERGVSQGPLYQAKTRSRVRPRFKFFMRLK